MNCQVLRNIYYPYQYDPYRAQPIEKTLIRKNYDILASFLKLDKVKSELIKIKELEKKYLDYGSGSGRHLNHIRELYPKWKLYGFDKSKFAKENLKKNNFECIEDIEEIPDNFFDVINLSSVIEHLEFPEKTIQLLNKKLIKGGLIIIKTPNWSSLARILFKKSWVHYDIPRHIYVFSSKNLKKLLIDKNFRILRTSYSKNLSVELKSFYRLFNIQKRPRLHKLFLKLLSPLGLLLNFTSMSSTVTVIGKKND